MPIPQSVLLTMSQRMKEGKRKVARDLDQTLKTSVFPAMGVAGSLVNMQNDQSNDPNVRTSVISGAVRDGAMGYQSGGIGGLLAGGITGGITSALATLNRKEQNYEADQNKYLNDMYGSVVGDDYNFASMVNAAKGGEMNSAEGEQYVPIQTEAKRVGRKLIKEKLVFSDGTMADVNATKPHSEMKKDLVTDVVTSGTYVFPVNTKITQKDLDLLISYTTGDYSENGKNFGVEEFTLRDILGKNFEGSFAEAAHIVDKKYPVADTEDVLDPVTKITNSENIANRSKIIAHLIRLNEAKIKGIKLDENKIKPEMNAKKGGYVKSFKKGGSVIDPAKMKAEIQRINEERNNPSRTVPLAKMPEMGSVNDPVSNRVTGEYGNAASAYDSDKSNKEKYDAMVSAKNNYFNYMKSAGVGTGPNNTVAFRPKATSQDDYMVQNLKGLGMYDKNSDIIRPNVGYSFWNTPAQKQNAIVNGGAVAGAPADPNKTTAPVSKGTGTGTGTKPGGSGIGGGPKDWKDKAFTERWQRKLKAAGLYQDGVVDGMWGEKTNKAYAEYLKTNKKGSNTSPVSSPVSPVVAPVVPKSVSYVPGESTMKYTATDYNPTNNSNLAAPVSYFEQKGLPYSDVPDVIALRNANEMNATALTFAFPWLGYGQKGAATAATGREMAKVVTKETTKEVAKAGTKEMVKTQAANNFSRLGSGSIKGAGSFKNAATGAKAAMDSGAIRTSVEAIRNGILQARKIGNRAEVQRLMKTLEQLRKSNPSAGIYKRGGYVMKMAVGGSPDPNPKGKIYKRKNEQGQEEEVLIGDDQNLYLKNQGGVYEKKDKKLYDSFMNVIGGGDKQGWAMLSNSSSGVDDIKKKHSTPVSAWSDGATEYDPGVTGDLTGIPNKQQMYGTFPTGDKKSAWSDGAPEYDPTLTMDVQPKYQDMYGSFPSIYDMGPIDTSTSGDNSNPVSNNTTNTDNTNSNNGIDDILNQHRDMIDERMTDAHRDALDAKSTYKDLAARVGARDVAGAIGGIMALNLQNRKEPRAFKRPRFMAERYRGLSAQQINQEAESTTGAGVEAVKQMNRESGSMTSRLGSALMSRLTEQQGQIRKQYVNQNTELERAKYNEYAGIQDFNVGEEARAKRIEIDNGNKVIAGTQGVISKYFGSANEADMANTSINRQIDLKLKDDIYTLSNQRLGIDVMGMDYDQQIREIDLKKSQIEAELKNMNIGEEERRKYEESLKTIKALEAKVAADDLKNKKK
ncbi:MAG: hypothetical protein WAT79_08870 [Saprospiraceae bacterium]